jgi:hypothetical protein
VKTADVRFGGWVLVNGEPFQLETYDYNAFLNGEIDAKPIPLSVDWLIKLGFDNKYSEEYVLDIRRAHGNTLRLRYLGDGRMLIHEHDNTICVDCPWVHTLQNLYHALTGEELEETQKPPRSEQGL